VPELDVVVIAELAVAEATQVARRHAGIGSSSGNLLRLPKHTSPGFWLLQAELVKTFPVSAPENHRQHRQRPITHEMFESRIQYKW
jgi:hypothetical protein